MFSGVTGLLEFVIDAGLIGVFVGQAVRLVKAITDWRRHKLLERAALHTHTSMTINSGGERELRQLYTISYLPNISQEDAERIQHSKEVA